MNNFDPKQPLNKSLVGLSKVDNLSSIELRELILSQAKLELNKPLSGNLVKDKWHTLFQGISTKSVIGFYMTLEVANEYVATAKILIQRLGTTYKYSVDYRSTNPLLEIHVRQLEINATVGQGVEIRSSIAGRINYYAIELSGLSELDGSPQSVSSNTGLTLGILLRDNLSYVTDVSYNPVDGKMTVTKDGDSRDIIMGTYEAENNTMAKRDVKGNIKFNETITKSLIVSDDDAVETVPSSLGGFDGNKKLTKHTVLSIRKFVNAGSPEAFITTLTPVASDTTYNLNFIKGVADTPMNIGTSLDTIKTLVYRDKDGNSSFKAITITSTAVNTTPASLIGTDANGKSLKLTRQGAQGLLKFIPDDRIITIVNTNKSVILSSPQANASGIIPLTANVVISADVDTSKAFTWTALHKFKSVETENITNSNAIGTKSLSVTEGLTSKTANVTDKVTTANVESTNIVNSALITTLNATVNELLKVKTLTVTGVTTSTSINNSGLITTLNLTVNELLTVKTLTVSGVTTTSSINNSALITTLNANVTNQLTSKLLTVTGATNTSTITNSGLISTLNLTVTELLSVKTLNVSGVSTTSSINNSGLITTLNLNVTNQINTKNLSATETVSGRDLSATETVTSKNANVSERITTKDLTVYNSASIQNLSVTDLMSSSRISTNTGTITNLLVPNRLVNGLRMDGIVDSYNKISIPLGGGGISIMDISVFDLLHTRDNSKVTLLHEFSGRIGSTISSFRLGMQGKFSSYSEGDEWGAIVTSDWSGGTKTLFDKNGSPDNTNFSNKSSWMTGRLTTYLTMDRALKTISITIEGVIKFDIDTDTSSNGYSTMTKTVNIDSIYQTFNYDNTTRGISMMNYLTGSSTSNDTPDLVMKSGYTTVVTMEY